MVCTMVVVVLPQRSGEVDGNVIVYTLLCVAPWIRLCGTWISRMLRIKSLYRTAEIL